MKEAMLKSKTVSSAVCQAGLGARDHDMLDWLASDLSRRSNDTLNLLFLWLHAKRRHLQFHEWTAFISQVRRHSILQRLHRDPLTHRAYAKPRGYAGDAALLDYIYSVEDRRLEPASLDQEARDIFHYTRGAPASRAVQARRRRIAELIDATAARCPKPKILSIAAGHLCEADVSESCMAGKLGEWVALDQDRESLTVIQSEYGHLRVLPRYGTVRSVLREKVAQFDCVYAAGLFDYLPQSTA